MNVAEMLNDFVARGAIAQLEDQQEVPVIFAELSNGVLAWARGADTGQQHPFPVDQAEAVHAMLLEFRGPKGRLRIVPVDIDGPDPDRQAEIEGIRQAIRNGCGWDNFVDYVREVCGSAQP